MHYYNPLFVYFLPTYFLMSKNVQGAFLKFWPYNFKFCHDQIGGCQDTNKHFWCSNLIFGATLITLSKKKLLSHFYLGAQVSMEIS